MPHFPTMTQTVLLRAQTAIAAVSKQHQLPSDSIKLHVTPARLYAPAQASSILPCYSSAAATGLTACQTLRPGLGTQAQKSTPAQGSGDKANAQCAALCGVPGANQSLCSRTRLPTDLPLHTAASDGSLALSLQHSQTQKERTRPFSRAGAVQAGGLVSTYGCAQADL